ncbi:Trk system potassium transporter TrkA [Rubinisphaera margarita]|uniref:Trk system potassium transporter TrkA n=1 Tax=Rubinisphaera margarita TaxID=2909586 RepID=UPI001EE95D27|nr:Trk system potassium transporter TrkA [Rubinisphaera margarita]MCG6157864.1 Trk system potassium transporter TrkA [Rubinisphaera margarita]
MNVVILGAGTVGTSIAQLLCENGHNVRLVDFSAEALERSGEDLDIQTIVGSACDAVTLFQADVLNADLCLAVTSNDEVNLVGASLCKAMGAKRSISRIFEPRYLDYSTFDYRRHFAIDNLLSLEQLTALELAKTIRANGLFTLESFARGGIEIQEVEVQAGSKVIGQSLRAIRMPANVRIGLVTSGKRSFIPHADDAFAEGDRITLVGERTEIRGVMKLFQIKAPPHLDIIIAGGGKVGFYLAKSLERERYRVTIMEVDEERCHELARQLPEATILHANATSQAEMREARVGKADVFIASTGRDEDNIICGVEARELGTGRILSVVRRPDYVNVLEKLQIDFAVSPRLVMARQILGMVSGGPILAAEETADGEVLIWEVEVQPNSPVTRIPLKELSLSQTLIAAIVRDDYVRVPTAEDVLKSHDSAVVLVNRQLTSEAIKLFMTTKD